MEKLNTHSSNISAGYPERLPGETFPLHNQFLPQLLFYILIFTIPYFQLRQLGPYPFMKIDWLLTIALAVIIIPNILSRKGIPENLRSNLWPWLIIFLIANLISSLLSPYRGHSLSMILNPILIGYVFIAFNMLMISKKGFEKYLPLVLAWSIGINSFLGFLGYFFGYMLFVGGERGCGLTIGANNMAMMCVFTIPLLVHWLFHAKNRKNVLIAALLLIVNVLGVISSASRGGFISLVIISFLLLFELRHRFHPKYLGLVIAIAGIVIITFISFVPKRYFQRQQTIMKGTQADKSTMRRKGYLIVGWDSFKEHPLLGAGTLSFSKIWVNSEMTRRFNLEERPAHNTYVEVLVGTGIIGLFFFLMLLGQTFSNFTRAKKIFKDAGLASMASLASAYRLSFIAVAIYFLFKSGLDHKLFLLSVPLSQVALTLASKHLPGKGKS